MTIRKEKIKTIAIIFLAVLLVLTLFSNTIMNYSLVQVGTEMVESRTITSKVRGNGTVTAGDAYSVTVGEARTIATVAVKTGQEVEVGDVLFTLEDGESEALTTAKQSLAEAEKSYEAAIISSGITAAERAKIEAGTDDGINAMLDDLEKAQDAIDAAQKKLNKLNNKKANSSTSNTSAYKKEAAADKKAKAELTAAKKALSAASTSQENKQIAYDAASTKYQNLSEAYNNTYGQTDSLANSESESSEAVDSTEKKSSSTQTVDETKKASDKAAVDAAKTAMDKAYEELNAAKIAYNEANKTCNDAQQTADDAATALAEAKEKAEGSGTNTKLENQISLAEKDLEAAQTAYTNLSTKYGNKVSLATNYAQVNDLREQVSKLEEKATKGEITAAVAGTVSEIMFSAGQAVAGEDIVMSIQPESSMYTISFSVTENQSRKIQNGDIAEVVNYWGNSNITGQVISIKRASKDQKERTVTVELKGEDIAVGDNYTVSIGEKSSNYDLVVPTSSIREDSDGKYILIIDTKSTPLGNRYYARRCDVEIITSDDNYSAITGALEGYEYVITTTNKPVEVNQQVRLAD